MTQMYQPPEYLQSYRFKVEIDGVFSAAFSRVSGLGVRLDTVPYRVGTDKSTMPRGIPALSHVERVTFMRGVVGDYDMISWIWSVCSASGNAPTGVNMRRNITITIMHPDGSDGPRWFLNGALPVSYTLSELDSMSGEVLFETLEVACANISREVTTGYENIQREQTATGRKGYNEAMADYERRNARRNGVTQ